MDVCDSATEMCGNTGPASTFQDTSVYYDKLVNDIGELVWNEDLAGNDEGGSIADLTLTMKADVTVSSQDAAEITEDIDDNKPNPEPEAQLETAANLSSKPEPEAHPEPSKFSSKPSPRPGTSPGPYRHRNAANILAERSSSQMSFPTHSIANNDHAIHSVSAPCVGSTGAMPYVTWYPPATFGDTLENVSRSHSATEKVSSSPDSSLKSSKATWNWNRRTETMLIQKCSAFTKLPWNFYMEFLFKTPTGSIKDHIAEEVLALGYQRKCHANGYTGATMIVPLSASLAVSLAHIGIREGFKVIAVLEQDQRRQDYQKIQVLQQLQVKLIFSHGNMIYEEAGHLQRIHAPDSAVINEFVWKPRAAAFYAKLAQEILQKFQNRQPIQLIICNSESAGLAKAIKLQQKDVIVIGARLRGDGSKEPEPFQPFFIDRNLNPELSHFYESIEGVNDVKYDEAAKMLAYIERTEGISLSPSSGAVLCAALRIPPMTGHYRKPNMLLLLDENVQFLNPDNSFLSVHCRLPPYKPQIFKWWNNLNLSHIAFTPPYMISATLPVSFALDRMKDHGTDHMITMDTEHRPVGVVTRKELEKSVHKGRYQPETLLNSSGVASKRIIIVPLATSFGKVMEVVGSTTCCRVIITQSYPHNLWNDQGTSDFVVGSITPSRLREYEHYFETNYPVNRNLDPAFGIPLDDVVYTLY